MRFQIRYTLIKSFRKGRSEGVFYFDTRHFSRRTDENQIHRATLGNWQFYFYRTQVGAEVDLVLISPAGKMTCIEIKYSLAPTLAKGFYQSIADLKPHYQYVIIPSGTPYFLNEQLKVCSLSDFLNIELALVHG